MDKGMPPWVAAYNTLVKELKASEISKTRENFLQMAYRFVVLARLETILPPEFPDLIQFRFSDSKEWEIFYWFNASVLFQWFNGNAFNEIEVPVPEEIPVIEPSSLGLPTSQSLSNALKEIGNYQKLVRLSYMLGIKYEPVAVLCDKVTPFGPTYNNPTPPNPYKVGELIDLIMDAVKSTSFVTFKTLSKPNEINNLDYLATDSPSVLIK